MLVYRILYLLITLKITTTSSISPTSLRNLSILKAFTRNVATGEITRFYVTLYLELDFPESPKNYTTYQFGSATEFKLYVIRINWLPDIFPESESFLTTLPDKDFSVFLESLKTAEIGPENVLNAATTFLVPEQPSTNPLFLLIKTSQESTFSRKTFKLNQSIEDTIIKEITVSKTFDFFIFLFNFNLAAASSKGSKFEIKKEYHESKLEEKDKLNFQIKFRKNAKSWIQPLSLRISPEPYPLALREISETSRSKHIYLKDFSEKIENSLKAIKEPEKIVKSSVMISSVGFEHFLGNYSCESEDFDNLINKLLEVSDNTKKKDEEKFLYGDKEEYVAIIRNIKDIDGKKKLFQDLPELEDDDGAQEGEEKEDKPIATEKENLEGENKKKHSSLIWVIIVFGAIVGIVAVVGIVYYIFTSKEKL